MKTQDFISLGSTGLVALTLAQGSRCLAAMPEEAPTATAAADVSSVEIRVTIRLNHTTCVVWKCCATLAVALAPRMPTVTSSWVGQINAIRMTTRRGVQPSPRAA